MENKLTIIYYHEVVSKGKGYSYQKIEEAKFEEQMKYLHDHGYHTLFFSDLKEEIPEKAVIVSFDDGFRTVYQNAAPIMEKHGIKGNVYLPTSYINQDDHFMTWIMIKELYDKKQFEMQAHTHHHVDIRTLDAMTMSEEIRISNRMIKKELGYVPVAFCMPFGTYDSSSVKILKGLHQYKYILGSFYGNVDESKLTNSVLPRIGISNDDSIETFADKLSGKLNWKGPLQKLRLQLKNLKKERIINYEY